MNNPDRLAEIRAWLRINHAAPPPGERTWVQAAYDDVDWLVDEVERLREVVKGLTPYAYAGAAEGSEDDMRAVNELFA